MAQSWLLKTHVDNASRECSITPGNFISPSTVNELSIVRALTRTVDDLLDRHDWNQCTYTEDFTGTGDAVLSLPAHFRRLCRQDNAVYETSPNKRPILAMSARGDWSETEAWNFTGARRFYRIQGLGIEFLQPLPVDGTANVAYVSNWWIVRTLTGEMPGGGGGIFETTELSTTWTDSADESLIPGILLELGIIWRFKMAKGLPYADYKAEYESNLARKMAEDSPARKIDFTAERNPDAHPMRVPIPDFIPSS